MVFRSYWEKVIKETWKETVKPETNKAEVAVIALMLAFLGAAFFLCFVTLEIIEWVTKKRGKKDGINCVVS